MSAWYVSKEHMAQVVSLLVEHKEIVPPALRVNPNALGRKLFKMNAAALLARYGATGLDTSFVFPMKMDALPPAHRLQLAHSLGYQCSEGAVPDTKLYRAFYRAIDVIANTLTPEQIALDRTAPWSI